MRIIFDLRRTGLGDNGGSSTLVKSANTLLDLGHDVYVVDSMPNKHTWTPLKPPHIKPTKESKIPDADVIIATGYKSVAPTVSAPARCGVKAHWIRAWEHWQMSEQAIVKKVLKQPTLKLVNSICLRDKLKHYNVDSYIVRPGYDLDIIQPNGKRKLNESVILGGLFRAGVHGKRKRTKWIFDAYSLIKIKFPKTKLFMFGSESQPSGVDRYLRRPTMKQKSEFYNSINIWLAPTMSEGLHMPPAEAMMTECPVVGTNAPLSGMQDYLIHNKTGLVSKNNFDDFCENIIRLMENKKLRKELGKNSRKRILEIGDRNNNMKKMVDLLESLL